MTVAPDGSVDAGLPWPRPGGPRLTFPPAVLAQSVPRVARLLLGAVLETTVGGERTSGVIVETEAYLGPEDAASHAATRTITARNRVMFGPPGVAYVYRSYGVHWCVNVVAAPEGTGGAVLIRGVDPLEGEAVMARRRQGRTPLAAGPGRLTQALGITGAHDGLPLDRPPLRLLQGHAVPDEAVDVTPRIGITRAVEAPLRYLVRGRPGVSR